MFFEAAIFSAANLVESCYVNIVDGEFIDYERRTALLVAAAVLFKHGPDIPAGILLVLLS